MLQANAPSRCSHPRGVSIPASSSRVCHAHACCACLSAAPGCARRKAPPRHACSRILPVRVNSADSAAAAAPPHACSYCACLSVVPDKPRLGTTVVGSLTSESLHRRCAALLTRRSIQIGYSDAAFKSTLARAGVRPAAETAHNKTLQFK